MKTSRFIVLALLSIVACTKTENDAVKSGAVASNLALADDTARIPLIDLRTGTYLGFVGGLYPNGSNTPPKKTTYTKTLASFSATLFPLDKTGKRNDTIGVVGFISLGGSIGGHNMAALKKKTVGNPLTNPMLKLLNCNNGGGTGTYNSVMNPNDPYWDHVRQVMTGNLSYKQVQVVYLESEDSLINQGFPNRANLVRDDIEQCARTIKQKFVNVKLIIIEGRTATFGDLAIPNKEPNPYYNGWGCKFAIEDQINGVPGTEYKGKTAVAPLITWGWYQWADTIPRTTDGFKWTADETSDGLHATDAGQDTLASHFQNFLLTDSNANHWYAFHNQDSLKTGK